MEKQKPVILIPYNYYFPGYKAGGPIRSLTNLVEWLGDTFSFKIITRDRDFQDKISFPGISTCVWHNVGKAQVMYLPPSKWFINSIYKILSETDYDILYLNSFLGPIFTIQSMLLYRLGMLRRKPVVLAPRGEFSPGFLALKRLKRCSYILVSKAIGLYKHVTIWQASTYEEKRYIQKWFGKNIRIIVAPNLPKRINKLYSHLDRTEKVKNRLKAVFLGRVCATKNLLSAIEMCKSVKGELEYDIYGPIEDEAYWMKCESVIRELPNNIRVQYKGVIPNENVPHMFSSYDMFFFPTRSESFGHVILEAMLSGCPVLISDRTPWRDLEQKDAGWDISLEEPGKFSRILQKCVAMNPEEHQIISHQAYECAVNFCQNQAAIENSMQLFNELQMNFC